MHLPWCWGSATCCILLIFSSKPPHLNSPTFHKIVATVILCLSSSLGKVWVVFESKKIPFCAKEWDVAVCTPTSTHQRNAFALHKTKCDCVDNEWNTKLQDCQSVAPPNWPTKNKLTPNVGIEPKTTRLKVVRSTNWADWAMFSKSYIFNLY